jgi:propanol-preferring alcohol dehydrogenase
MRAMVLRNQPGSLALEERAIPRPGPGQLLIRVSACGVCRTDPHVVEGEVAARVPVIPGHQIVGVVDGVGSDVGSHRIGERVGVAWLARSCGRCCFCVRGQENLCDAASLLRFRHARGLAGSRSITRKRVRSVVACDDVLP